MGEMFPAAIVSQRAISGNQASWYLHLGHSSLQTGKNKALAPLCHLVKTLIPQENALLTFTVYYSPKVMPLNIITLGFKSRRRGFEHSDLQSLVWDPSLVLCPGPWYGFNVTAPIFPSCLTYTESQHTYILPASYLTEPTLLVMTQISKLMVKC